MAGLFLLQVVIHSILRVACTTIGSQHERVRNLLMLPVRPLSRQCQRLSQTRRFDNIIISSPQSTTASSQHISYGGQQKRHFFLDFLAGFRERLIAPVEAARLERLNTEASQSADAERHNLTTIIQSASKYHSDLDSFVEYTTRTQGNENSTVYKGTYHEYNTARVLKEYGFTLDRVGKPNDFGIDLLGQWRLPMAPHEIKIVVQCKASKTQPAFVRELAGACQSAPLGWRGRDVMALLVSDREWTPGVHDAISKSSMPFGFMVVTREGDLEQFYWNATAADAFLTGLQAMPVYGKKTEMRKWSKRKKDFVAAGYQKHDTIALLWDGEVWKP